MTGERSHVDVAPILFLKETLKYDARTPPLTNKNLFARDRNLCCYCGRHYVDAKLSRDHIHPVSKGGKNVWQNVATACKSCNHEKDDNLLNDTDMELLYVPYVPNHAERLIMQNRNILADQMDFLEGFLPEHSRLRVKLC
jgi:5-methylcytosine-specific restriction endonuclease McrA